jgi:hypothetical protein
MFPTPLASTQPACRQSLRFLNPSGQVTAIEVSQWKVWNLIAAGKFVDTLAWAN